ncbi:hypothetical protein ACJMK2_010600 [Sinanodonta woodiana]|uniref:Phosphatidylinositol-3-phosphatase SAC1 n=1 Tax=Sinanodonta woodiana TaxID=1069815 RepID=A0ABD3VHF9_SINWO
MAAVHESLQLHITSDKFFIEPSSSSGSELLTIDRVTQEISLQGPYLIVITKKQKVGEVNGHTIWKVLETEIHSYKRTMLHLTEQQNRDNSIYLSMVDSVLKTESYYFSTTYDLTHTLQRLYNTSPDFLSMPLHERADQRFLWNGHILRELAQQPELGKYCLPIVHGFIAIKSCLIHDRSFNYVLISRRSIYRAGTRFYLRGIDPEGQVANFVESEQIVEYEGYMCSFVQTRGSIPLFWSQRPNLKYKPKPQIHSVNHITALKTHLDNQVLNYGKQVIVNLVNGTGSEGELEKAFQESVASIQRKEVRYEFFDFHHECRNMRWDRLSVLVDRLENDRKQLGYFQAYRGSSVVSDQKGVFRTNCIDCLDRTNVVQSLLAKVTLEEQLMRLGVLEGNEKLFDFKQFNDVFNNLWADNADVISIQYAGTGALKTDFTRIGKRTKWGLLMDGWNSVVRYFKNNFSDGFRQDAIDLFLGNHVVEETEGAIKPSPLQGDRDWKFYAIPVIFIIALAMFMISILLPDEHFSEQVMYVLFWGMASLATLGFIYLYGTEFVDNPKLVHTKVKAD